MLLRKKKSGHAEVNANAWMISYADMATILLAMFIVLSTLGKDQTGISLYYGTGSFKQAMKNFGLPGLYSNSSQVVPLKSSGTAYPTDAPFRDDGQDPTGRIIDGEQEYLQHFLTELSRAFATTKRDRTSGQCSLDVYEALPKTAPYFTGKTREVVMPLLPLLRRGNYRLQVVIWAPMPNESTVQRAAGQAQQLVAEIVAAAELDPALQERLVAVGQTWRYRDVPRPILSVVVTKSEPPMAEAPARR
jgi:flagellar motor protein MotB